MIAIGTAHGVEVGTRLTVATTIIQKWRQTTVHHLAHRHRLVAASTRSQNEAKSQKVMEAIDIHLHRHQPHATVSMIGECSSQHSIFTVHFSFFVSGFQCLWFFARKKKNL